MKRFGQIGRAALAVLSFLMRVAGLIAAVRFLIIDPAHATAPQVLLSGVLLMGGQATKDLLLGVVDRMLTPSHHPEPPPPALEVVKRGRRS